MGCHLWDRTESTPLKQLSSSSSSSTSINQASETKKEEQTSDLASDLPGHCPDLLEKNRIKLVFLMGMLTQRYWGALETKFLIVDAAAISRRPHAGLINMPMMECKPEPGCFVSLL